MAVGVRMTLASFSAVESGEAAEAPDCAETGGAPAGASAMIASHQHAAFGSHRTLPLHLQPQRESIKLPSSKKKLQSEIIMERESHAQTAAHAAYLQAELDRLSTRHAAQIEGMRAAPG